MTDEPTDTEPTHDDFTSEPREVEYPSTLRITALPEKQAQAAAVERAERWEQGEEVPHVVNFEDRFRLRELLTDWRMELLEAVMENPPESICDLAGRLDRDVHDDLYLLAEHDIIHFEEDGRAKKPYVPYDTVRIEIEFGRPRDEGTETSASA
jgi:predicted transcriptional regulator